MIVDFHTHVFSPHIRENRSKYIAADPLFALLYSNEKAQLASAEELIASMDRNGIDVSVILNMNWNTQMLCQESNDYILESIARYTKRLVGFCTVKLDAGEAAIKEIERCAKAGIKGVGEIRPSLSLLQEKGSLEPLVETCIKHNLILLTHASEPVGHHYPGKGDISPHFLYSFIYNFPQLKLVCAHWGGGLPFYALMPEMKAALQNVYFDTAASPLLYRPQIYEQVTQLVGADKILFGSDFPLLAQSRVLDEINPLELNTEERKMIHGGNAMKLLGSGG